MTRRLGSPLRTGLPFGIRSLAAAVGSLSAAFPSFGQGPGSFPLTGPHIHSVSAHLPLRIRREGLPRQLAPRVRMFLEAGDQDRFGLNFDFEIATDEDVSTPWGSGQFRTLLIDTRFARPNRSDPVIDLAVVGDNGTAKWLKVPWTKTPGAYTFRVPALGIGKYRVLGIERTASTVRESGFQFTIEEAGNPALAGDFDLDGDFDGPDLFAAQNLWYGPSPLPRIDPHRLHAFIRDLGRRNLRPTEE